MSLQNFSVQGCIEWIFNQEHFSTLTVQTSVCCLTDDVWPWAVIYPGKQIKWMDSSRWEEDHNFPLPLERSLCTSMIWSFTSFINRLVVWEQRGSHHSLLTHSYQVAAPLQCISLKQNLGWMLIKNSLTTYFLGIHINHQYRYMCAGVPIDTDIFYRIHLHASLSTLCC